VYFTCCKILGVEPGSDPEIIKSAFRKTAMELHPDHNSSEKAHQYFILVKNAYHYLMDHPYSKEEVAYMEQLAGRRKRPSPSNNEHRNFSSYYRERTYTLSQILKQSLTARILFIFFHIIFLIIGIYLIIRPIYDILFYPMDERSNFISAYFTLASALFLGIVITLIFVFSAYNYLHNR